MNATLNAPSRMDRNSRISRGLFPLLLLLVVALTTGSVFAALKGAVYTTDVTATVVNENVHYAFDTDVYLSGGPQNLKAQGLPDGRYYFQVTDPSGKTLLSTDNAVCRQLDVVGGRVGWGGGTLPPCRWGLQSCERHDAGSTGAVLGDAQPGRCVQGMVDRPGRDNFDLGS